MLATVKEVVQGVRFSLARFTDPDIKAAMSALSDAEFMLEQSTTNESLEQVKVDLQDAGVYLELADRDDLAEVIERQVDTVRAVLKR